MNGILAARQNAQMKKRRKMKRKFEFESNKVNIKNTVRLEYATLREHTNHTQRYIREVSDGGQRCVHKIKGNRV